MKKALFIIFLLSFNAFSKIVCMQNDAITLARELASIKAKYPDIGDVQSVSDKAQSDIDKAIKDCQACKQKEGDGWVFGESSGSKQCVCVGAKSSKKCVKCKEDETAYTIGNVEQCKATYVAATAQNNKEYCESYGLSFTQASGDTASECKGSLRSNGRSIASGSSSNNTNTNTNDPPSLEETAARAVLADENANDEKKEAACAKIDGMKWKKNKKECVEKGGLFGGGGDGGLLGNLDFDSVTSVAGEALGNETVQNALLGAASGMGIGMVTSKFFSQTCEDEIKDDKCFDAAIELEKSEALRGHCEENKAKQKCQEHFFANDRGFFKTNWCDDEENVMDADMKTKCFNISKDSYFETHCTEEKMGNLKTPECFEMKTANPKKFFEIYCSEGSAVQALPEFKSAGADRECAVMKKNPSINEDYDPDEESDDEDEDHDEDEDMDEDDSDDVAEYDSDDEGDNSDDDSEDMDDDEIADSDSDSDDYSDDEEDDGDLFADSDTGRAIASMEHSSVSQDLSASSDDKIMQLANMGHFNGDPALCEGSIYQVDSNCSMRKHANYLIKGKLGRVKIVGQKTLVCVYENHTGARFSAVIKKDCQL